MPEDETQSETGNAGAGDFVKPRFFILGGARCGTSSLARYLRENPGIYMPSSELNYFSTDFNTGLRRRKGEDVDAYLSWFAREDVGNRVAGEKSVNYLPSETAVPNILAFQPDALFIVMARHPVERFLSLHQKRLFEGRENVKDPEKAWRLQYKRSKGRSLPRDCLEPKTLQYGMWCRVGEQLERLYGHVSPERVQVIFFEDFTAHPREVYETTLDFLRVETDGRSNFDPVNTRKTRTSFLMFWAIRRAADLKRALGMKFELGVLRELKRRNEKVLTTQPEPLNGRFRDELAEYFTPDIEKLERITGRDLSHWYRRGTKSAGKPAEPKEARG